MRRTAPPPRGTKCDSRAAARTCETAGSSMANDATGHRTTAGRDGSSGQTSTVAARHVAFCIRTQQDAPGAGVPSPASTAMAPTANTLRFRSSSRNFRRRSDGRRRSDAPGRTCAAPSNVAAVRGPRRLERRQDFDGMVRTTPAPAQHTTNVPLEGPGLAPAPGGTPASLKDAVTASASPRPSTRPRPAASRSLPARGCLARRSQTCDGFPSEISTARSGTFADMRLEGLVLHPVACAAHDVRRSDLRRRPISAARAPSPLIFAALDCSFRPLEGQCKARTNGQDLCSGGRASRLAAVTQTSMGRVPNGKRTRTRAGAWSSSSAGVIVLRSPRPLGGLRRSSGQPKKVAAPRRCLGSNYRASPTRWRLPRRCKKEHLRCLQNL